MLRLTSLLAFIILLTGVAPAQHSFNSSAADSVFSSQAKSNAPGGAVAVIKNGKQIYEKTYGMANIEKSIPIDSDTKFWIASVSKQFTAAAIYMLAADGNIDIKKPVTTYLSALPDMYNEITVDQLLHHTSGMRDGFVLTALSKKAENEYTNENVFKYLSKQKEFNFKPGTDYEYNNSGYVLLAMLVEKVSQETYPDYLKNHIFLPAGMKHTFVTGKYESDEKTAEGYRENNGKFQPAHFTGNTYGSTGIITTLHDLEQWAGLFQKNTSGNKFVLVFNKMKEPGRLINGQPINYGGGIEMMKYKGTDVFEHFGADEGFKANIVHFPSSNVSVIGLSNNTNDYDLSKRLYAIADIANGFSNSNTEPEQATLKRNALDTIFAANKLPPENLAGEYYSDELESSYNILNKNGQLVFEFFPGAEFPLTRINDSVFKFEYVGDNFLNFTSNGVLFSREGVKNLRMARK